MHSLQDLLLGVYGFNKKLNPEETNRLIPWLMGVTGSGKTFAVRKFANQIGLPLRHIILQGISELEFLGIPKHEDGKTTWGIPEWYSQEPLVYFFDEVDKAHPEILSVILSLVADFQFRGNHLHPDSIIIFASQPIEPSMFEGSGNPIVETLKALRSRSFFIPSNPGDVLQIHFPKTHKLLEGLMENEWELPVPDTISFRQLKWLQLYVVAIRKNFNKEEELLQWVTPVAKGITRNYDVVLQAILEELRESISLSKQTFQEINGGNISDVPQAEIILACQETLGKEEIEYKEFLGLAKGLIYLRSVMGTEEFDKAFSKLKETVFITVEHPFNSDEEFSAHTMLECAEFYCKRILKDEKVFSSIIGMDDFKIGEEKRKELDEALGEFLECFREVLSPIIGEEKP